MRCEPRKPTKKNAKKKVEWKATRISNLVRRNGTLYYVQLKVAGKTYRRSLETEKMEVARVKLPLKLNEIRAAADGAVAMKRGGFETLRGCFAEWLTNQEMKPSNKESTKVFDRRRVNDLLRMLPVDAPVSKVGVDLLRKWWKEAADHYNPRYANNLLSVVRAALDMQVQAGIRSRNVAMDFDRMPIPDVFRELPSGADFKKVVIDIRAQNKRSSEESADLVEWIAYTGMRPDSEAQVLDWKDVGDEFIIVRQGAKGTKNYKERMIPILDDLRKQIDRRRQPFGPMWSIKSMKKALGASCERLGLPHMTPYSLRHLFATRCVESGIDFATVAKWMGHTDGGVLAAKVYGHVSDAHGLEAAKRVNLG